MTHAENKIEWCLKKATKEGTKHRGLKTVSQNTLKSEDHIKKLCTILKLWNY